MDEEELRIEHVALKRRDEGVNGHADATEGVHANISSNHTAFLRAIGLALREKSQRAHRAAHLKGKEGMC